MCGIFGIQSRQVDVALGLLGAQAWYGFHAIHGTATRGQLWQERAGDAPGGILGGDRIAVAEARVGPQVEGVGLVVGRDRPRGQIGDDLQARVVELDQVRVHHLDIRDVDHG